jgi:acyl-CoA hydrolase
MTPQRLIDALESRASELRDVEIMHIHTYGPARYADSAFVDHFRVANFFVGHNMRNRVGSDRVDYLPCFLHEIPKVFRSGRRAPDVAFIQVSVPDAHGMCTLGTSVDVARAAVDCAKIIVAQVNPNVPRVHGDGFVHISKIHYWIDCDDPLVEAPPLPLGDTERAIGRHIAGLVEDGATLQMGIGSIPDAALEALTNHKHLGIHTEMWSDGAVPLLESGVVDNSLKKIHPGKTVGGFVVGTKRSFDYLNDNPSCVLLDIAYVNNPTVAARNRKLTAINSAVEIDLTGQVCADSIGSRIISGVGGQMDFLRAAAISEGGKPILALASRAKRGEGRIVPTLRPGAGVVTTRCHVHYVVTEYGVADLFGRTLGERAKALTAIAHPDDREGLERAWHGLRKEL